MSSNYIFAGIDDGHRDLKAKFSNGVRLSVQSRAASGLINKISINDSKNNVFNYTTDDGIFSVGDIEHADETAYDDYPVSAQNRVIVAHALRMAGFDENDQIIAVTGLPLKRFYLKGKMNEPLILAKKKNLLKRDVVDMEGFRPAPIVRHEVLSEGIASWLSYVLDRGEDGKIAISQEKLMERTAIVDIGGRTLDIAVVRNWALDGDRSATEEIGMLSIINGAKNRISDEFGGIELTDEQVEQAVMTQRIKIYGQMRDVSPIVNASILSTVNNLRSSIKRCLKQVGDIDNVFFVGGTTKFLEQHIQDWFPNQRIMNDPVFANADGMLKYAEFVMGIKA